MRTNASCHCKWRNKFFEMKKIKESAVSFIANRMWMERREKQNLSPHFLRKEYKFAQTYAVYNYVACLLNGYVPVLGVFDSKQWVITA